MLGPFTGHTMRTQSLLLLTSLCLAFASLDLVAAAPVFRAGAATSNITPTIAVEAGARTSRPPATHVHDELHARCLVLDDGEAKLALVVCDLRHISAEVAAAAKVIIEKTTGIPPQCVVISATHSHTTGGAKLEEREGEPYFEYSAFLTRRIADGVLRAHNQLEPAQIGWSVAEEPTQVFNRRWFVMPERGPIYGAHLCFREIDFRQTDLADGLLRAALCRRCD
jgi:neutral ceramidase